MSILWCDDFGGYGTGSSGGLTMLNGPYASVNGTIVTDPDPSGSGERVWKRATTGNECLRRVFPSNKTTIGLAFRQYMSQLPNSDSTRWAISFQDGSNNPVCSIVVGTTGGYKVYRDAYNSNEVASTSVPAITANSWQHVEMKVVFDSVNGEVEIRVDGVVVLTATTINTGTAGSTAQFVIRSLSGGSNHELYIRDLVAWDTLGSLNNDFLGTVSVLGRVPIADVSFNWAAASGTTGYNMLDSTTPDDTVEYVSASDAPPAASVFSLTALPADISSVRGMVVQVRAKKVDGGDGTLQNGLVSNGDIGNGVDRPLTTAFTYYSDVIETDPDTGVGWGVVSAGAAQLRINRTT